jgi:hypothetical protein
VVHESLSVYNGTVFWKIGSNLPHGCRDQEGSTGKATASCWRIQQYKDSLAIIAQPCRCWHSFCRHAHSPTGRSDNTNASLTCKGLALGAGLTHQCTAALVGKERVTCDKDRVCFCEGSLHFSCVAVIHAASQQTAGIHATVACALFRWIV